MKDWGFLLLLCLVLGSCTGQKELYVIGVSQCSVDAWRDVANSEILQEASFYSNLSVQVKSVHDDSRQQIRDIEQFISDGVDLLVVSPNESTVLTPVVEKAYRAGIPVILYDRKIDNDSYSSFVGGDNWQIGRFVGMYALDLLKGKGRIAVLRGTRGATADKERYEGFVDALQSEASHDVRIVAETYANFIRSDAALQMELLLRTPGQGPFDLVFALNDEMAAGVSDAYSSMEIPDRPFILGIDALRSTTEGGLSYISNGMIDASFIYPTGGNVVIDLARRILMGVPYERENILQTEIVNRSNIRIYQLQIKQMLEKQRRVEDLNMKIETNSLKYERAQALSFLFGGGYLSLSFC